MGFLPARDAVHRHTARLSQKVQRPEQCELAITEIRTQGDITNDRSSRRYLDHFSLAIRATASRRRGSSTASAKQINPSPDGPKPTPGVQTTPASSNIRPAVSVEVNPFGVCA